MRIPTIFRRDERAIALITTLAAMVVVMMLMGAFFANWQSYISLNRYSSEKQACREALSSLADGCRFQLEGERRWGAEPGKVSDAVEFRNGVGEVILALRPLPEGEAVTEFEGLSGISFFEGETAGSNVRIALSVVNNLDNELPLTSQNVGPKACRLQFMVKYGGYTEKVEVTLRRAGFFDSTVLASKKIEIDADKVNFSSTDPLRNQIRSESEIFLPDTPNLKFTPADDALTVETGTVWSKEDIYIYGNRQASKLRAAAEDTGADFLPNAPSYYKIPELRKSDIDYETDKPIIHLPSSHYGFREIEVTYQDTRGNSYTREVKAVMSYAATSGGAGDLTKFHYLSDPLTAPDATDPEPDDYVPNYETVTYNDIVGKGEAEAKFELDDFGCDLDANQISLSAGPDYRVSGDFGLSDGSLVFIDAAADPENPVEGYLSVDRDLSISGQIINGGKIVAGRNVHLSPFDLRVDKLDEASDVAIYAGNDVIVRPPFSDEGRADARRYFVFKGLVYAGNDFKFLSSVIRNGTVYQFDRKLYIEGALVAKRGEVVIKGNESVELKYNRDFLDDLLENPLEKDVVQLEVLAWRPL